MEPQTAPTADCPLPVPFPYNLTRPPWAPEDTLPPIQPKAHFVPVPDDVAEDRDKLFELVTREFGERFSASNCNISPHYTFWAGFHLMRARKDDCIVIFRNKPDQPRFFVLRVYKVDPVINGKKYRIPGRTDGEYNYIDHIWDKTLSKGIYAGLVPAECEHETSSVAVRYITFK